MTHKKNTIELSASTDKLKPECLARIPLKDTNEDLETPYVFKIDNYIAREILAREFISMEEISEETAYSMWAIEKAGDC